MLFPGSSFRLYTALVRTSLRTLQVTKGVALAQERNFGRWPSPSLFPSLSRRFRTRFFSLSFTYTFTPPTTAMASPSLVPNALQHLADSLRSLPPHTSLGNITLLSSLLREFATDVGPLLSIVLQNEQDALLSNSSWISTHLSELQHLISRLPPTTVARASHQELVTLIKFDSLKYTIWDIYTPDVWTLLTFFFIAICAKFLFNFGLRKAALDRTQAALSAKYGHEVEREVARSVLKKYVGSM